MRRFIVGLASVCWLGCGTQSGASREATAPSTSAIEGEGAFRLLGEHCPGASAPFDFSRVRASGRVERTNEGLTFAWSGTSFDFRFRGTELALELEDAGHNWFGVEIDGVRAPGKLKAYVGSRCYELARQLASGEHRIKVTRLTEASLGESTLISAVAGEGGELLGSEPGPTRRVEIIGDSITAAYGVEGKDKTCHFSSDTENASLSYAALFAKREHAEVRMIAWSGKGVFSNRGSTTDTVPMPPLWERTLPAREDSHWDFSSWQPDAVVVNLGANDFAPENKDKTPFGAAYLALLSRVRQVYPNAVIFCALSPGLNDDWPPNEHARTRAREAIQAAIARFSSSQSGRAVFFEHAVETEAEGWGCDWHPSRAAHARFANELAAAFAKNLSW